MNGWYEYGGYTGGAWSSLVTLLIIIALFLICREIICWYWKINRAVELLERQTVLLERIEARLAVTAGTRPEDARNEAP